MVDTCLGPILLWFIWTKKNGSLSENCNGSNVQLLLHMLITLTVLDGRSKTRHCKLRAEGKANQHLACRARNIRSAILSELLDRALTGMNPEPSPVMAFNTRIHDDPDNESSASRDSCDSEMEPFPVYRPKIEQLLCDIGLPGFSIGPIHHGDTYQNCIYALSSTIDADQQYILRVPVCPDFRESDGKCEAIENDAAVLAILNGKLPVPRVTAYSTTKENALNTPYAVQTKLPGSSLDDLYEEMDQPQKLSITDQYVELMAKIESIKFPEAGTFTASGHLPETGHNFQFGEDPSVSIFNKGEDELVREEKTIQARAGPDLKSLLYSHVNGWIQSDRKNDDFRPLTLQGYKDLIAMLDDLDRQEAFEEKYPIVLHHWDLEPRNIMVSNEDGIWKITGVIDWDDALALPRPLARRPPDWIWDFEPQEFTGYLNNDHHPHPNLTDEGLVLKRYFDDKAAATLENYLEDGLWHGIVV